jgi:hypothetical protein
MAHFITLNYNEPGLSESWNKQLFELMPTGFYTDVTMTKVTNTTVQVSTFTAYIKDQTSDLGVRIENSATESGVSISSAEPYVVLKLNWQNNTSNDFEYDNVAFGAIGTNDLIIGMGNFTGSVLNSFDYSLQSKAVLKNDGAEVRKLDQLPEKTTLALEDLMLLNNNSSSNDPSYITGDNLYSSIKSNVNYQNDFINGALDLWTAGNTSITGITDGDYISDMIKCNYSGTMDYDSARESSIVPDGFNYSLKLTPTTAQGSIGAGDYFTIRLYIEGYNAKKYIDNGWFTKAYQIYSVAKTGTITISARNSASNRAYVKEYNVNSTGSWLPVIVSFPWDDTGGTWDTTNGVGVEIVITLAGGSTYQTTADTWQTGDYFSTSNQDNFCDNVANVLYFGGFSCGAGTQEIGFDGYDIKKERIKLYSEYYVAGDSTSSLFIPFPEILARKIDSNIIRCAVNLPVRMRDDPSISFIITGDLLARSYDDSVSVNLSTGTTISNVSVFGDGTGIIFYITKSGAFTANGLYYLRSNQSAIVFDGRF